MINKKIDEHSEESNDQTTRDSRPQASGGLSESAERGKEMGRQAYGKAREATGHALSALKIVITDPMGGQRKAIELLGDSKALYAGIVFVIIFAVTAFLVLYANFVSPMKKMFGPDAGPGFFRLLISAFIPPLALAASFLGINKIFGGKASMQSCVFSTGIALIPSAAALLLIWLLGRNIELVTVVGLFGMTITILLMNSALLDIQRLSTRKAVLLTPTLILLTAFIVRVLVATLLR